MDINRTFAVIAPRDQVWKFITSPENVASCMPGCEQVEAVAPGHYRALVKIKIGPIKTSFSLDVETTEERAPEFTSYVTKGQEGGKASRLNAESSLFLEAIDDERTKVTYSSHIKLVGRLGKFADGVMKKIAESVSDQFIAAMRAGLETERARPNDEEKQEKGGLLNRCRSE